VTGRALLVLAGLAAALPALSQAPTGALRGMMKPGLYEKSIEQILPGIKTQRSTRQDCHTEADVDSFAEEEDAACKTTDFQLTGAKATYRAVCKRSRDPSKTTSIDSVVDVQLTFEEGGFSKEARTTFTVSDKPMVVVQRYQARYLGDCPAK